MTKNHPHAIVLLTSRSPMGGTPTMGPTTTVEQAARAPGGFDVRMRVGPAWVGPAEREVMQVIDPSTGKTIADVPVATKADAQSALARVSDDFAVWGLIVRLADEFSLMTRGAGA